LPKKYTRPRAFIDLTAPSGELHGYPVATVNLFIQFIL